MTRVKPSIFLLMLISILVCASGVSAVWAQEGSSTLSIQGSGTVPENTQSQYYAYYNGSRVSASWSLSSTDYASISSSGLLSARSVSSNQTVNVKAIYSRNGTTYEAYKSVTITNTSTSGGGGTTATLSSLAVTGPSSVSSGTSASYTATATFSNGTTQNVTSSASWSASPALGNISGGNYSPSQVTSNQTVTIAASYTTGGVTRSGSETVTITPQTTSGGVGTSSGSYQVLAYNDLGMHCYDADFSVFGVLPLYNVLRGQVILKGATPQILTNSNVSLTYQAVKDAAGSINSTSANKTNFWTYVQKLFGVSLAVDTGIKGQKMPGTANTPQPFSSPYDTSLNGFAAEGIPITAYDDAMKFNPEPLMRVSAKNSSGTVLSTLDVVVPASNEMNCSNCHVTGGEAANTSIATKYSITTAWSTNTNTGNQTKENVLILHDGANKTTLYASYKAGTPTLCASCHYSAALDLNHTGPSGAQVGPKYMSRAMHQHHGLTMNGTVPDASHPAIVSGSGGTSACYQCHPGVNTKCLRGAMATAGQTCESCHGDMLAVGGYYNLKTTGAPRNPWLDEPKCQSCHTGDAVSHLGTSLIGTQAYSSTDPAATPIVATNTRFAETNATTLYRFSTGHGGVACESCHGSTHAEWPTSDANDNVAATQIQGHSGVIIECTACHGTGLSRTLDGPHGMHNVNDANWYNGGHEGFLGTSGANCKTCHGTDGLGTVLSKAKANRTFTVSHDGTTQTITVTAGTPIACNLCHSNYINGGG